MQRLCALLSTALALFVQGASAAVVAHEVSAASVAAAAAAGGGAAQRRSRHFMKRNSTAASWGHEHESHEGIKFRHRLRVCNAYPSGDAVDVYHGRQRITETPMLYKTCGEYEPLLKPGDRLQFEIDGANVGSFAVAELPNNDAVLVLVIYRHEKNSPAVAFESHVFSNLINAQIAVIDTYKGGAKAYPRIQDAGNARTSRSEELRYDSVVAVNPGTYEVVLQSEDGEIKARRELVALNRESYIVVRCGVEAHEGGRSYPQDLIVFPHSDAQALMGAAGRQARPLGAALPVVLAAALGLLGLAA